MPLLPRLVPRLYRARFEPTQAVRQAMEPVWKSVVAAAAAAEVGAGAGAGAGEGGREGGKMVIKRYLDAIFEDLLKAAGSRKWRERQAAVAGLASLLPGRTFKEIMGGREGAGEGGGRLEKAWVTGFRAVDDLKESVQLAGIDLAKSLMQLTGRLSNREETPGEEVREVVGVVLPLLLTQGLVSKAKEVQAVAVVMLVRMVKGAGECLRPWLAELVSALIEAQSAIEPQQLQYMQFHATSSGMTEEGMEVSNQTALSSLSLFSRPFSLPACLPSSTATPPRPSPLIPCPRPPPIPRGSA